jgi:hypothetical protein
MRRRTVMHDGSFHGSLLRGGFDRATGTGENLFRCILVKRRNGDVILDCENIWNVIRREGTTERERWVYWVGPVCAAGCSRC